MCKLTAILLLCSICWYEASASVSTADANKRIKACCDQNDIDTCGKLCRYDVTTKVVEEEAPLCLDKIKVWLYCASEGYDHTEQCKQEKVPSKCLSFCKGDGPSLCFDEKSIDNFRDCGNSTNLAKILRAHQKALITTPRYKAHRTFPDDNCPDKK